MTGRELLIGGLAALALIACLAVATPHMQRAEADCTPTPGSTARGGRG